MKRVTETSVTDDACDFEVGSVMSDITNTYSFMRIRPVTPVNSGLVSCRCVPADEQMNEINDQHTNKINETIAAVESIQKELQSTNEKEMELISEAAIEALEIKRVNDEAGDIIENGLQEHIEREDCISMVEGTKRRVVKRRKN